MGQRENISLRDVLSNSKIIMELSLISLAIAPGVAIALFVYFRDKYEKEPLSLLLKVFFAGFLTVIPVALIEQWLSQAIVLEQTIAHIAVQNFLFIGFTEEVCKYFCLYAIAYSNKNFNEPFDGIVYAVMVSMGFATSENLLYVLDGGLHVAVMRLFTAVPAHATFGVLMGYFVGLAKFKNNSTVFLIYGLIIAAIFHGAYDFFLSVHNVGLLAVGALLALAIGIRFSFKAMKILNDNSPFKYSTVIGKQFQSLQ